MAGRKGGRKKGRTKGRTKGRKEERKGGEGETFCEREDTKK